MASPATLLALLQNGSDVTLFNGMNPDKIHELAEAAHRSGAKLTITASMNPDVLLGLSAKFGKTIAFMNGVEDLKKD